MTNRTTETLEADVLEVWIASRQMRARDDGAGGYSGTSFPSLSWMV
jgi:hypothetical protein